MGDEVRTSLPPPPPPALEVLLPPRSSGQAPAPDAPTTPEPKPDAESPPNVTDPKDAPGPNPEETTPVAPTLPECIPRPIRPLTPREIRLQKVMKPLTVKCIPDREPGGHSRNFRFGRNLSQSERDELRRRNSRLVFTVPKVRAPEVIEGLKREKKIHKLIKYMKKSWRIKVDPRQGERDLVYRTIEAVHTKHPDNYDELLLERDELIEKRGESSKQQGFFCGYDANYPSIYNVELDTPMLVFQNLPPDLKISAARWLKMKALKEELKRKRDAFLPRPPYNRSRRPNFARGKLYKDPGGMHAVDDCIKIGERFRQLCKGSHWYAKVLATHFGGTVFGLEATPTVQNLVADAEADVANPENEEELQPAKLSSKGDEGGVVLKGVQSKYDKYLDQDQGDEEEEEGSDDDDIQSTFNMARNAHERRESLSDGRKYQREMLQMEYMIIAMYHLIKSMLNIKVKQLKSNLPLPDEVVKQLRDYSPEPKKPVVAPVKSAVVRRRGQIKPAAVIDPDKNKLEDMEEVTEAEFSDDEDCIEMENTIRASMEHPEEVKKKTLRETMTGLDPFHMHVTDILQPRKQRSSHLLQEIKRVHSMQEKMASKNQQVSAVAKIKSLAETPDHAADRMARNAATYGRLFERRQRPKAPVWHHVHVDEYVKKFASNYQNVLAKDPKNLTEADAEEVVEMAIRKREMLPTSRRWPDSDDIPTPTFPFARSPRRVGSEEMSKRNLLASMPHMDDVPGTPVRRLYKLAGVRTTEKQTFNTMLDMKNQFRAVENKVRLHTENEVWKFEFDTIRRYKAKLPAIYPDPIYEWCIAMMRGAVKVDGDEDDEEGNLIKRHETGGVRRQATWYRKLKEECSSIGAARHNGCQQALEKLFKYCDIDMKSKAQLISRFALLVVSLPTTELGSRNWQAAIQFLLEHFFNAPKEIIMEWLEYRRLPLVA